MNLVPTLEKWCANAVAEDFWRNHLSNQDMLDAQGEDRETGTFAEEWSAHMQSFVHRNVSDLYGRRVANSTVRKALP